MRKAAGILCALLGLLTLAVAVECAVLEEAGTARYRALPSEVTQAAQNGNLSVDFASLCTVNEDVAGWVHVEGTGINYPVVQPSNGKPADYYLHHDFWGTWNPTGCPFLDQRVPQSGLHKILYAHRMNAPGSMFNDVARADLPDVFSSLGTLTWTPVRGKTETYTPLCSMAVDRLFGPIQTFTWRSISDLRAWLFSLAQSSSTRCTAWQEGCRSATGVITLSTCTRADKPSLRTLTIFVRTAS